MRSRIVVVVALTLASYAAVQGVAQPSNQEPRASATQAETSVQSAAPAPAPTALLAQQKPDALLLYKQGRDLDAVGKRVEAVAKYKESVAVCDRELAADPTRMDAYTVKCWSLFRLERYRDVIAIGNAGLKVRFDARIVEVMGEAYFHSNDDANAIRYLQRYLDNVGEYGDRVPTAYFYMAESYLRQKRLDHADIAYTIAVYREPGVARWWYRYAALVESLGEYKRAYDLYARALRLSPGLAEAVAGQARVKARL